MKGKLITCAIFSVGSGIGFLLLMVSAFAGIGTNVAGSASKGSDIAFGGGAIFGFILIIVSGLVSLIVGILVLTSLDKMPTQHRSIAMATGVLAILGGLFLVNFIVGLIAASKANDASQQDMLNQQYLDKNSNNNQNSNNN